MLTNNGRSVAQISAEKPTLLVFLRHFGCTFCREALADLAKVQDEIAQAGTQLILIHMADHKTAEAYFERYGLNPTEHVSDPSCQFYKAFGLTKGTPKQLFGLQSWIRGFDAGVVKGLGVGTQLGDGFQMPGVFAVHRSEVKASFIHKLASDRPVYLDLVKQCCAL
ncbi:MAG: peroxiredoxin-like family protein [Bacteroidota bacterium]